MRARLASFDELVTLVATLPHRDLAHVIAGQMVTMGALDQWDSGTIVDVAEYVTAAVKPLDLPTFTSSCGDNEALKFWCSVDPHTSYREWAARYEFVDTFTVIGAWNDSEPLAFGAIDGRHEVEGDLDYRCYKPWAEIVEARGPEDAMERAVDRLQEKLADDD